VISSLSNKEVSSEEHDKGSGLNGEGEIVEGGNREQAITYRGGKTLDALFEGGGEMGNREREGGTYENVASQGREQRKRTKTVHQTKKFF